MTLNASGEITGVNDAFERLLGYPQAELVGCARWPFLSDGHEEKIRSMVRQSFQGNPPEPLDLPATCSDNTIKDLRWSAMLIRDGEDPRRNTVALFGAEAGSRRQRREESGLGEIEDRYRAIFENSGIGLMFTDEKMTIVLVNKEFEKTTGYSREETEGRMSWTTFVAQQDDLERMKTYNRLRRIDPVSVPAAYITKVRIKGGDIRDMLLRVTMVPGTGNSLVSFLDMTDRRLAEEAIRESEEKYRTLVENMQDGIYRSDLKGNLTYLSPAGARLLGYESADEMIGKNIAEDYYRDPGKRGPCWSC